MKLKLTKNDKIVASLILLRCGIKGDRSYNVRIWKDEIGEWGVSFPTKSKAKAFLYETAFHATLQYTDLQLLTYEPN